MRHQRRIFYVILHATWFYSFRVLNPCGKYGSPPWQSQAAVLCFGSAPLRSAYPILWIGPRIDRNTEYSHSASVLGYGFRLWPELATFTQAVL